MVFLILLKFVFFARKNQRHLTFCCLITAAAVVNEFWPKKKRKNFLLMSKLCFVNQLDFTQMCNEYTLKLLQDKTLQVERVKIEQPLIKLKLQEYIF